MIDEPAPGDHDLDPDAFQQFERWFQEALARESAEPSAMALATADRAGAPSVRIVLLRSYDRRGFVFYTNYESQKGQELAENPRAALVFHWPGLERQVRITGTVSRVSRDESARYFASRPFGSRLSAWVSQQSQVVASHADLEDQARELAVRYADGEVPLPSFWGGFRVRPDCFEFWQGRPNRLHVRLRYTRRAEGDWLIERLAP